jgi:hypothetical protein
MLGGSPVCDLAVFVRLVEYRARGSTTMGCVLATRAGQLTHKYLVARVLVKK